VVSINEATEAAFLQRHSRDFRRVNNAHLHEVAIFAGVGVVAEVFSKPKCLS